MDLDGIILWSIGINLQIQKIEKQGLITKM